MSTHPFAKHPFIRAAALAWALPLAWGLALVPLAHAETAVGLKKKLENLADGDANIAGTDAAIDKSDIPMEGAKADTMGEALAIDQATDPDADNALGEPMRATAGSATGADGAVVAVDRVETGSTGVLRKPETLRKPDTLRKPEGAREGMTEIGLDEAAVADLKGTRVYGNDDESVGEISDLVVSPDGRVNELVLDVGGFLGLGEKPVAVDMRSMQFMRAEDGALRIYIDATEEQLSGLPEYRG